ncbi:uncharacterized protein G2W53_039382 [Senna tora]|uniref:Uncharacterized protein n=1 Tax=Senna tora TaxID=362788 RepID=A0A834SPW4_9FABA|nr:uncharacterized protein G2W53_039382 [Senna tora]
MGRLDPKKLMGGKKFEPVTMRANRTRPT